MIEFKELFASSQVHCWPAYDISVGAFTVIDATEAAPVSFGHGTRLGHHVVISEGVQLGRNVKLDDQTFIGQFTSIGDGSEVHGVKIHREVVVGKNSFIGGEVSNWTTIGDEVTFMGRILHTYRHPGSADNWRNSDRQPSPTIHDHSVIGEGALLIGGVEIGPASYVSAGEIVKSHVPPEHVFIRGQIIPMSAFRGFIKARS